MRVIPRWSLCGLHPSRFMWMRSLAIMTALAARGGHNGIPNIFSKFFNPSGRIVSSIPPARLYLEVTSRDIG